MRQLLGQAREDLEILVEMSPRWWTDSSQRPADVLAPLFAAGFRAYEMENNYWPWRYLWPRSVRRPWRCTRDLTKRVRRLDLILSRNSGDEL
jgi:hypothetical protein